MVGKWVGEWVNELYSKTLLKMKGDENATTRYY